MWFLAVDGFYEVLLTHRTDAVALGRCPACYILLPSVVGVHLGHVAASGRSRRSLLGRTVFERCESPRDFLEGGIFLSLRKLRRQRLVAGARSGFLALIIFGVASLCFYRFDHLG